MDDISHKKTFSFVNFTILMHSGPENLKRPREIKEIHFTKNFFDKNPFFGNFKNGQKSIFELQFHVKKSIYFISQVVFFVWTFKIFWLA